MVVAYHLDGLRASCAGRDRTGKGTRSKKLPTNGQVGEMCASELPIEVGMEAASISHHPASLRIVALYWNWIVPKGRLTE
ncbi:hypothetical protein AM571_PC01964 (plasmid) [Rhizobium etli 8C-3]|uniref:Uncharacterized protein n=1 Tax=Rhizobium etli 8C-3 TaxID=538025 RepID=A0A1L5PHM8_RHIET|nr:hypothetical protein AM571_PC01964 [Rhizobium etli 8C-3]